MRTKANLVLFRPEIYRGTRDSPHRLPPLQRPPLLSRGNLLLPPTSSPLPSTPFSTTAPLLTTSSSHTASRTQASPTARGLRVLLPSLFAHFLPSQTLRTLPSSTPPPHLSPQPFFTTNTSGNPLLTLDHLAVLRIPPSSPRHNSLSLPPPNPPITLRPLGKDFKPSRRIHLRDRWSLAARRGSFGREKGSRESLARRGSYGRARVDECWCLGRFGDAGKRS